MSEPLLCQYRVLSEQRLHFGRLYWQSVAFLFVLLIGGVAVLKGTFLLPASFQLILAGSFATLMGFVADRLRRLESHYEDLLENIERALISAGHEQIQIAPKSGKHGARFIVTLGLFAMGVSLIVLGVVEFVRLLH